MIDNYIEKDIMRRVKITYVLHECGKIKIRDLAENMNTSFHTIKRDCQTIATKLKKEIVFFNISRSDLIFRFKQDISCYELVRKLYADSLFLKICYRYLLNDANYTSISEEEFISVTKVFKLKKDAERFLKDALGTKTDGTINFENHLKVRYILLTIWMRGIGINDLTTNQYFFKSKEIARDLGLLLKNNLNKKSQLYLQYSIFLCLTRKNEKINIDNETINYLKTGIIFSSIQNYFEQNDIELSNENISFISCVYKNMPYNTESYRLIEVDYQYYRNRLLKNYPTIANLIKAFETAFEMDLIGEIEFEKPLIDLVYTTSFGINQYLLNQYYFINKEDVHILNKVRKIINTWVNENISAYMTMDDSIILQFSHLIMPVLKRTNKERIPIIIVSKDEYSYMLFRKNLCKIVSENFFFINEEVYYSVEDIPKLFYTIPCFIICERCLLNHKNNFFLPISINTLTHDLRDISNLLFSSVLCDK